MKYKVFIYGSLKIHAKFIYMLLITISIHTVINPSKFILEIKNTDVQINETNFHAAMQ